jgi:TPR repeat protein
VGWHRLRGLLGGRSGRGLLRRSDEGSRLFEAASWREQLRLMTLEALSVPELMRELGSADEAEAVLRGADRRGDAQGAFKLGMFLEAKADLAGAEAAYRRGDERGSAEATAYLGGLAHRRGDLRAAEAAYRRASERGNHLAAYNLGLLLHERGDAAGARPAFEQATGAGDAALAESARARLRQLGA